MLRLLLALPFSVVISAGLFAFMALMVDNSNSAVSDKKPALSFNMLMVEKEPLIQRRKRSVPEQPQVPEPPPRAQVSKSQLKTAMTLPEVTVPDFGIDVEVDGLTISAPAISEFASNQQAMPLYRVEPRYPSKALKRNTEGYVVMTFTIDQTGKPTDITVIDANPKRMFEREAKRALKKWKYQPKVVDGRSTAQQGQSIRLEFKLAR